MIGTLDRASLTQEQLILRRLLRMFFLILYIWLRYLNPPEQDLLLRRIHLRCLWCIVLHIVIYHQLKEVKHGVLVKHVVVFIRNELRNHHGISDTDDYWDYIDVFQKSDEITVERLNLSWLFLRVNREDRLQMLT